MNDLYKKITYFATISFVVAISFCAGLFVDAQRINNLAVPIETITGKDALKPDNVDFGKFWKVWETIDKKYVDGGMASTTLAQDRVYGSIKGLVDSLGDPYSEFFTPVESEAFETELAGSLEGVGMTVGFKEGALTVIAPLKGSPAERAGVMPGDFIAKIDGTDSLSMNVDAAIKLIRGPKGTTVKLTLLRKDAKEPIEVSIVRDVIQIPTVETQKKDGVFIVKIYEFNATASNLFRSAMKEFFYSGSNKLIIDVRNNPGGYLNSAVDVASWFLPSGKIVVTEDYGDRRSPVEHRSKGYNVFSGKTKIVVLTNGGSASASEILAGALSDYGVATIVGEKTFGKGSVQEVVPIGDGTSLKITIAKWLTPLGKSISKEGLTPVFEVKMTQEDAKAGLDPQLDKAIEIVKKK